MKNYIRQWQIESESTPGKYYTVSLDYDGNFSCSCPHWIYRHKECKHIQEAKYLMNDMEEYMYLLSRWKKAITDLHQEGVWDDLYEDAQKIDLTVAHVQLKLALADEEIDEEKVQKVVAAIGLPVFPASMRDYDLPVVINITEFDPYLKYYTDLLKKLEDAFNNRTKTSIFMPGKRNCFTFRARNTKSGAYHLMLNTGKIRCCSHEPEYTEFTYYMLTPYIGVIKSAKVKKSQTAGV